MKIRSKIGNTVHVEWPEDLTTDEMLDDIQTVLYVTGSRPLKIEFVYNSYETEATIILED